MFVSHIAQLLSHIRLFETALTAALQASLSFTIFWSLLKLMSIESVMPSNHLILCIPFSSCLQSFPAIIVFSSESTLSSGGQNIGASASASVLPVNIQDWFSLRLTGLITLPFVGGTRCCWLQGVWASCPSGTEHYRSHLRGHWGKPFTGTCLMCHMYHMCNSLKRQKGGDIHILIADSLHCTAEIKPM